MSFTIQNTFMKASVKVHRLNTFKHFFKACSIYGVSRFDVTPSNLNSKLSNSPPSIRFSDLTDFTEITEPVSPVPQELFQFRDYEQLQHIFQVTLSNSATLTCNLTLFSISNVHLLSAYTIGELTAIRDTVDESLQGKESVRFS